MGKYRARSVPRAVNIIISFFLDNLVDIFSVDITAEYTSRNVVVTVDNITISSTAKPMLRLLKTPIGSEEPEYTENNNPTIYMKELPKKYPAKLPKKLPFKLLPDMV
jgi:hypothetical protein